MKTQLTKKQEFPIATKHDKLTKKFSDPSIRSARHTSYPKLKETKKARFP